MIAVMVLHDLCDSNKQCSHTFTKVKGNNQKYSCENNKSLNKNQVDYLRGLITMESMVIICLVVSYIRLLSDFHKKQLPPDILREEITNSAMLSSTNGELEL